LEKQFESSVAAIGATSTLQAAVNLAGDKGHWLILMRPQGIMEVLSFFGFSLDFF